MVPVLPKGELEVLLEAAIDLSKKGMWEKEETVSWQINSRGFKPRGVHVGQCGRVRNCNSGL